MHRRVVRCLGFCILNLLNTQVSALIVYLGNGSMVVVSIVALLISTCCLLSCYLLPSLFPFFSIPVSLSKCWHNYPFILACYLCSKSNKLDQAHNTRTLHSFCGSWMDQIWWNRNLVLCNLVPEFYWNWRRMWVSWKGMERMEGKAMMGCRQLGSWGVWGVEGCGYVPMQQMLATEGDGEGWNITYSYVTSWQNEKRQKLEPGWPDVQFM